MGVQKNKGDATVCAMIIQDMYEGDGKSVRSLYVVTGDFMVRVGVH